MFSLINLTAQHHKNGILSCQLGSRHEYVIVRLKHAADALEDLGKPENVDHVQHNARQDEQVPHDAELVAGDGPVHRVDFVPVRRNTGDTRQKES